MKLVICFFVASLALSSCFNKGIKIAVCQETIRGLAVTPIEYYQKTSNSPGSGDNSLKRGDDFFSCPRPVDGMNNIKMKIGEGLDAKLFDMCFSKSDPRYGIYVYQSAKDELYLKITHKRAVKIRPNDISHQVVRCEPRKPVR